jgi:branched-chain amino acid transport system ATP-binding protein
MEILEVQGLSKHFGALRAVDHLDLAFQKEQITAVIGPNGAGKTTLYNVITGKFLPSSGKIFLKGREITGLASNDLVKLGLTRTFQISNIFPTMSVLDNIILAAIVHAQKSHRLFKRVSKDREIREESMRILRLVQMDDQKDLLGTELSHGDKRRVELAIAMASHPDIILLDEPTAGMGKVESRQIITLLKELYKEEKICFVLTEHDMEMVFEIADRIVVLDHGRLLADGPAEKIKENPEVKEAYLGKEIAG